MTRNESIIIIINSVIENLSKEHREEILIDWWGIDLNSSEFEKLPKILQSEILEFDEPQRDIMNELYNPLIFIALRNEYIGVENDYLSKKVSEVMCSVQKVEGVQEHLLSCPCCKFKTLSRKGEYDICPVCFWEDDGNRDPNAYSPSNHITLAQARSNFVQFGSIKESSLKFLATDRFEKFSK